MATPRWTERAVEALYSFLGHSTASYGIKARCVAINALEAAPDLPTTWTSEKDQRGRHLSFPLISVYATGSRQQDVRRYEQGEWAVACVIRAALGYWDTSAAPGTQETLLYRLERAILESLTEQVSWSGCTLAETSGIHDVRDVQTIIRSTSAGDGKRVVWVECRCNVIVLENMGA